MKARGSSRLSILTFSFYPLAFILLINAITRYKREIEYTVDIGQLSTANNLELSMILHNIGYMEQLRSNLIYAISTNDMDKFNKELLDINDALKYFDEQEDG